MDDFTQGMSKSLRQNEMDVTQREIVIRKVRVFVCGRGLNIIGTPAPNTRLRLLETLSRSLILSLHVILTLSPLSHSFLLALIVQA